LRYPWGNEWIEDSCNVASSDTTPVDVHSQGVSPYGCADMLGNVQEWTNTMWGITSENNAYSYPYNPSDGREDPNVAQYPSAARVHRGGSYRSQPTGMRSSTRSASSQEECVSWRGFRVVMERNLTSYELLIITSLEQILQALPTDTPIVLRERILSVLDEISPELRLGLSDKFVTGKAKLPEASRIATTELTITLLVLPGQQPDEYLVQLLHANQLVAEEHIRIDRQALLEVEHSYNAHDYGMLLYDALFTRKLSRAYQRLIGQASATDTLRIQLTISEQASKLHALPWERLFHPFGENDEPLAASAATPFSRFLIGGAGGQPTATTRSLHLLLALANPTNLPDGVAPLDVAREVATLADLLAATQGQVVGALLPGRSGLPADLRQRLLNEGWRIHDGPTSWGNIQRHLHGQHMLHLVAHGQLAADRQHPERSSAYLLLENEAGALERVADQTLVDGLNDVRPLPQLIFLAASDSAKRPDGPRPAEGHTQPMGMANPFVGLAPKLVQAGAPAVVAMQERVPVELARRLTQDFYRHLWVHGQVDRALNEARALLFQRGAFEWAIPVLFLRLAGGQLFVPQPAAPPPVVPPTLAYQSAPPATSLPTLNRLSGAQFGQLQPALLHAFNNATLRQMVRVELDQNLDVIASGENLGEQIFNLIEWAQRTGNLIRLIQGALNAVPDNTALQAFVQSVASTGPTALPKLNGLQLARFYLALLDAFTAVTLRQMVRVEFDQSLEAVASGENLSTVVFNLIEWAERTDNLNRLIQGALNTIPGNPALQTFAQEMSGNA
jgi:hypothetical protein